MLRLSISMLSAVLLLGAPQLRADGLSAAELLKEVENCSLKLTGEGPPIDAEAEAMIVKVGKAVLAKGVSAHLFYVSPGKNGKPDDFGLILDATPAQVAKALPRFAKPKDVNGYLRDLEPIGDPDGTGNGQEKTLFVCRAGAA